MNNRIKAIARLLSINALIFMLTFIALEGLSSSSIFAYRMFFALSEVDPTYSTTQYDEMLGWISKPNQNIKDMYGKNRHFITNSQAFRNSYEISQQVPKGKKRVICSGDSFTLGLGVANDETFCAMLASLNSQLETVNLGETGYGVDQMYLKYQRYGANLQHDVHIFAFISADIQRMRQKKFIKLYPKPRIVLKDGELQPENVPVPRTSSLAMFFSLSRSAFQELRTVELANNVWRRLYGNRRGKDERLSIDDTLAVAIRIFEEVARINTEKGVLPVVVHLIQGSFETAESAQIRRTFRQALASRNLIYIDLEDEFRRLEADELQKFFDPLWYDHYTVEGHRRTAETLYAKIEELH